MLPLYARVIFMISKTFAPNDLTGWYFPDCQMFVWQLFPAHLAFFVPCEVGMA